MHNKPLLLVLLFTLIITFSAFSQNRSRDIIKKYPKYGIRLKVKNQFGLPRLLSRKEKLFLYIDRFVDTNFVDKREKIRLDSYYSSSNYNSSYILNKHFKDSLVETGISSDVYEKLFLPDSIQGLFKVVKITEKKDNYLIKPKKKFEKTTIYLIDLKCVSGNYCPDNIRLISVKADNSKEGTVILENSTYYMTIYSFFYNDPRYSFVNNEVFETISHHFNRNTVSLLFSNIWVVDLNIHYYKLFETNNLSGIYFVP